MVSTCCVLGGAVKDATFCREEFAAWWGSDRKTGANAGSSGEAPPVAHRPAEKEKQPEGKAGPVILRQAVSPALENKLTSFQGKR